LSVIIELSGVSCAGKTTVFPIVLNCLHQNDNKCFEASQFISTLAIRRFEKIVKRQTSGTYRMLSISMVRKGLIASGFLRVDLLKQHKQVAGYVYDYGHSLKCFRSYLVKLGMHHLIRKAMGNQRILIDEGVVHTVQSIFVSKSFPVNSKPKLRNDLEAYLNSIPLPDILVVVYNRNQQELNHRLLTRGHHRLSVANPSERKQFVKNSVYVEQVMLDILSLRQEIKIIKIPIEDNDYLASMKKGIQETLSHAIVQTKPPAV